MKIQYCQNCGEDINDKPNVEKVTQALERMSGMEVGKSIYLAILDKKFKSIDLCNICYTMMQNYRLLEGKDLYESAFIAPGKIKYKKKLRKYASYQNHLNRKA